MTVDRNRNIRGLISWAGPGNPFWDSYPSGRAARILWLTQKIGDIQYFRCGGGWKKLKSAADFAALNRAVDASAFGSAA